MKVRFWCNSLIVGGTKEEAEEGEGVGSSVRSMVAADGYWKKSRIKEITRNVRAYDPRDVEST